MSNRGAGANALVSFEPGKVCATTGALRAIEEAGQTPGDFLQRHLSGDWGELDSNDSRLNDAAARSGEDRILSAYRTSAGAKIWCIIIWNLKSTSGYKLR